VNNEVHRHIRRYLPHLLKNRLSIFNADLAAFTLLGPELLLVNHSNDSGTSLCLDRFNDLLPPSKNLRFGFGPLGAIGSGRSWGRGWSRGHLRFLVGLFFRFISRFLLGVGWAVESAHSVE
jgi:hypothetical protein